MTDIIPFPPREGEAGSDGGGASVSPGRGSAETIPGELVEAAAEILNDVLAHRRGAPLTEDDWAQIMRAMNFIDGANTIAREQGLPHGQKSR